MESINCSYDFTLFPKDEISPNDFMIVQYKAKDSALHDSIQGDLFKASGHGLPYSDDFFYTLYGEWKYDKKYDNYSFKVDYFDTFIPPEKASILKFLSSLEAVDKENANKIYEVFGLKTMEVIEKKPTALCKVTTIPKEELAVIIEMFKNRNSLKQIADLLLSYGLQRSKARQIFNNLGDNAVQLIKENPFHLTNINGITYREVDAVARNKNIVLDSQLRFKSAVICALMDNNNNGNTCSIPSELVSNVYKLINHELPKEVLSIANIQKLINHMVKEREITYQLKDVYLNSMYESEYGIAEIIVKLLHGIPPAVIPTLYHHIDNASKKYGITLAEKQKDAIAMALNNNFSIITGGPGTGKTTILKIILDVINTFKEDAKIALTAPTGRAARRMSTATNEQAQTLHKRLGLTEDGDIADNPLHEVDILIIDEASMLDVELTYKTLSSLDKHTQVVFVGDYQQLPSVGAGDVLRELIDFDIVPTVSLDVIYRQSDDSYIILNAQKISKGETDIAFSDDFKFISTEGTEQTMTAIRNCYIEELKTKSKDEVQILCPVKDSKKGVGVNLINTDIQNAVNPVNGELTYQTKTKSFRKYDRVMQLINDDFIGLSNGDIGVITDVSVNPRKRKSTVVDVLFEGMAEDNTIRFDSYSINQLTLSYGITIHKSQGSEYKTVIVPMLNCYGGMLLRNLLYTAITRGKEKVILIGEQSAINKAIRTTDVGRRRTHLTDFLSAIKKDMQTFDKAA